MRKSIYAFSAAATFFTMASGALAQTANSDRLLIVDSTGNPIFDKSISEPGVGTAGELNAVFTLPGVTPGDPVILATSGGAHVVFLTEPAGEGLVAGETPIFVRDAAGNSVQVSDAIVSTFGTTLPPQVQLISDGSLELQRLAISQPNFQKPAFLLVEDGTLQDLTVQLDGAHGPNGGVKIFAQSDLPEPASVSMIGLAATGLLARRRRA
ncbi:MAG: hypothetical protein JWM97_2824 [Phycisphaerales bacterium]|jgi:hypothetical protein|nr:hypothetical protein [Phycisphaerales bacterium]MDB5305275.1 hypothetical protein [Phycisphaerales bacterium]